jgi:hypothetical protein
MESEGSAKILALYVLEESQSSGTTSCGFLSSLKPQIYNLNKLGICGLQDRRAERIVDYQSPLFIGAFTKYASCNRFS